MKLKQEWYKSIFYWVITWKLLFKGGINLWLGETTGESFSRKGRELGNFWLARASPCRENPAVTDQITFVTLKVSKRSKLSKQSISEKYHFKIDQCDVNIRPYFRWYVPLHFYSTAQKIKFSIKDFFSKCDQICSFLWIWSHLLKKSFAENFIFV